MACTIRHVEPGDARAVHAILTSPHVVDESMRLPYAPLSSTESRLTPKQGYSQLVAVEEEAVVGFAELVTYPSVPRHDHVGEINMLVVRQDRQGHGIGRALVVAALDLADNWLMLERVGLVVWVTNEHAIRLYKGFGFEVEGTMRNYALGRGAMIDAHVMGRLRTAPAGAGDVGS
jgi:putative acetyltransferase